MGSREFPRKIFEKVFVDDINRLRSMEDMWKTRSRPEPLDYATISEEVEGFDGASIAQSDQISWGLAQNFAVFCESLKRLTARMTEAQRLATATAAPAVLSFDKDDADTLDFVASTANLRAIIFGIEPKSKFNIKQMAGNIIPAIATTNAMVAGLCVLQAFKIMRQDLKKARNVFLERSSARVINCEALRPPNPDCSVCGVTSSKLIIDPARATLNDLVEGVLKEVLGYGDEFSVNNEVGTLYDPDLEDNLEKKMSDLGVKGDSFLTVIDEDDNDHPRMNISLSVSEQTLPNDAKPVQISEVFEITRRPKTNAEGSSHGHTNGTVSDADSSLGKQKLDEHSTHTQGNESNKRKRGREPDDHIHTQAMKKGKISTTTGNDVFVIDDSSGGAIVIDD